MAVTECAVIPEREYDLQIGAAPTHELTYRIFTDEVTPFGSTVESQAHSVGPDPLPRLYQFFGSTEYGGWWVTRIRMRSLDNCVWVATVNLGPLPDNESPDDQGVTNPLNRAVRYWTENSSELVPITKDKDGHPIRNAAGDEFLDPLMKEQHVPILVAQKNLAATSLTQIIAWNLSYQNSVNDKIFKAAAAGKVAFVPIESGQVLNENGVSYYAAEFRFAFKEEGWTESVVNQGYQHYEQRDIDPENEKKIRAVDDNGDPTVDPVLLAIDGTRLPRGEFGNQITFDWRPEKDFGVFGV